MHPDQPNGIPTFCDGSDDRLTALVKRAFPSLSFGSRRIDRSGGDHVLLIVDDHFAFRFPRAGMHDLNLEIAVLKALRQRSSLPTPSYDFIDPEGRFAGYPYLTGSALTPARFAALTSTHQDEILATAALFLAELHGLSPIAIATDERWPVAWTAARYAERGRAERLPLLARHLPDLTEAIAAFYARHGEDRPPRTVVIHGDLVTEHILLDDGGRLSGIIDFGDVALGDAAQDFAGVWDYGAEAARRAVALYPPGATDPGLLARSRNHFIRYRLDRLFENLNARADVDAPEVAPAIDLLRRAFELPTDIHSRR